MPKDVNDLLKRTKDALDGLSKVQGEKTRLEEERSSLVANVGNQLADLMRPLMERIAKMARLSKEDIKEAIGELQLPTPQVNVPEIKIPKIEVPAPQVTVRAPNVTLPEKLSVSLNGHSLDLKKPLPVVLTDDNGKPYIAGSLGGGGLNISKIRFQGVDTAGVARNALVDEGGRLQVDIISGAGGSTYTTTDDVANDDFVSNMAMLMGFDGSTWDRIRNGEGTATHALRVVHASDVAASVNVTGFTASVLVHLATPDGDNVIDEEFDAAQIVSAARGTETNGGVVRVVHVADAAMSVRAIANSGVDIGDVDVLTLPNVTIGTVNPSIDVKQVSGFSDSVNVVGFTASVAVVGDVEADAVDSGNPVKVGGIARTANPAAVAAGDRVSATFDKLGRQVTYPYQVRDLVATARSSLTTGTETTLLAGVSGVFHDLVYVKASNNSSVAVTVDIRDATTGGIVMTLDVPANGVVGVSTPVPIPQNAAADTWTADMGDITGTTCQVDALFIKNV